MAVTKVEQFFGLNLQAEQFSVDHFAEIVGLKRRLAKDRMVQRLIAANGSSHLIVSIVKRQILLKLMKGFLRHRFLNYDESYYNKEVNTATSHDRRYGAEEKLLWFCLIIATGRTVKQLERIHFKPGIEALRRMPNMNDSLFEKYWEIMSDATGEYISKFKAGEVGVNPDLQDTPKKTLWEKIFS